MSYKEILREAARYWGRKGHQARLDEFGGDKEAFRERQAEYGKLRGLTDEERLAKIKEIRGRSNDQE